VVRHLSILRRLSGGGLHLPRAKLVCLHVVSVCTILGDATVPGALSLVLLKPLLKEWSGSGRVTQV